MSRKDIAPGQLPFEASKLDKEVFRQMIRALQRTARYGETRVIDLMRKSPKPIARGDVLRGWAVSLLDNGATLGNSVYHSYFVEVGRKPGKAPPLAPIMEWVSHKKGLSAKKMAKAVGKRRVKRPKGGRGYAQAKRYAQAKAFAFYVQMKIGKKGTPGKFVLKRAVSLMSRRLKTELRAGIKIALVRAGRA